eukprot:Rhum_TRINITY_DN21810_c0_g1::Rhum_TRINITY_DN21810_c0_g1_i1::g.174728::m.174728
MVEYSWRGSCRSSGSSSCSGQSMDGVVTRPGRPPGDGISGLRTFHPKALISALLSTVGVEPHITSTSSPDSVTGVLLPHDRLRRGAATLVPSTPQTTLPRWLPRRTQHCTMMNMTAHQRTPTRTSANTRSAPTSGLERRPDRSGKPGSLAYPTFSIVCAEDTSAYSIVSPTAPSAVCPGPTLCVTIRCARISAHTSQLPSVSWSMRNSAGSTATAHTHTTAVACRRRYKKAAAAEPRPSTSEQMPTTGAVDRAKVDTPDTTKIAAKAAIWNTRSPSPSEASHWERYPEVGCSSVVGTASVAAREGTEWVTEWNELWRTGRAGMLCATHTHPRSDTQSELFSVNSTEDEDEEEDEEPTTEGA